MLFFLIYILIYHSGKEIPCNHASEARSYGEPQALATEIWGKICPPSDQEAIV